MTLLHNTVLVHVYGGAQETTVNPFNGMKPNFTVFGIAFTQQWQLLLAGAWALAIVALAFRGVYVFYKLIQSKRHSNVSGMADARDDVKGWAVALGAVLGLPLIFTIMITLFF